MKIKILKRIMVMEVMKAENKLKQIKQNVTDESGEIKNLRKDKERVNDFLCFSFWSSESFLQQFCAYSLIFSLFFFQNLIF